MDDWRVRVILGAFAVFIVGVLAWSALAGDDETDSDPRNGAETACRLSVEKRVDPLDVDHRDPGSSTVTQNGDQYRVKDRAAIGGDLVDYECVATELDNGGWRIEDVSLR